MQELMVFDPFKRDWLQRHKGSIPRKRHISSWGLVLKIGMWVFIAIGSAVFSGTHSVPAAAMTILQNIPSPYREYLSLTVFTVMEFTIFGGSLSRRESRIAFVLMTLAFIGALSANLGSSIAAVLQNGGDAWIMAVGIVTGILAPSVALGAGEMIHLLHDKHQKRVDDANADYERQMQELDAKINREYTKYVKEHSPVQSVNSVNFNDKQGRDKPSRKLQEAVNWLNEHPEHLETESRELTQHIGASHVTIWKAQQLLKSSYTSNGNGRQHE